MGSVSFDSAISDEERRTRLCAGDIFIYSPTKQTRALIDLARQMLEKAFSSHDPRTIHERKTPEEVADLTHLPEEAIALYDDDTAKGERILHFGDRERPQAVATRIIEAEPTTPASTGAVERS